MSQIKQGMRQANGKSNWPMRDYKSKEFFLNHPIRKLVSYVKRQTPAKKRQNASQPIKWLETAPDKAKFTQVTAVLTFLPKVQPLVKSALHEFV